MMFVALEFVALNDPIQRGSEEVATRPVALKFAVIIALRVVEDIFVPPCGILSKGRFSAWVLPTVNTIEKYPIHNIVIKTLSPFLM